MNMENHIQADPESSRGLGQPMTRTRCPACTRLFAVETEILNAMTRAGVLQAEFSCTSDLCKQPFALKLPVEPGLAIVPSVALQLIPLAPEPVVATPAPLKAQKVAAVGEKQCPRCGTMTAMDNTECARCGIVFNRILDERVNEEIELGGTRELSALWDRVTEDYEDRIRHERFLNACNDANSLSYAMKKYAQILVSAPHDDIARVMRNRIVALVSAKSESSKIPIRLNLKIPKLNSMALFMGGVLIVWGIAMPHMKHLMQIGLSMVLLVIAVRFALRSRI